MTAETKKKAATAAKKTTAAKEPAEKTVAEQLIEISEQVAYDRKAENILRLDMRGLETAQSDYYILCSGLSEPHVGAIAERIQREVREKLSIRPILCNGDQRSGWIIIDFGYAIIHVMSPEARQKYQLEELWGDAPCEDIIVKLDKEAAKRLKAQK